MLLLPWRRKLWLHFCIQRSPCLRFGVHTEACINIVMSRMQGHSPRMCHAAKYPLCQHRLVDVRITHMYFTFHLGGGFEIHPICPPWCRNGLRCEVTQVRAYVVLSWALLARQGFRVGGGLLWGAPDGHSAWGWGRPVQGMFSRLSVWYFYLLVFLCQTLVRTNCVLSIPLMIWKLII